MFIIPQIQKDRQADLRLTTWASRYLLLSIFPHQNFAGKVFSHEGYNLVHTASFPPQHRYPYRRFLDWSPYPSFNGSTTYGFFQPLVINSTLRWQTLRSRLQDKMTFLVALRPWAQPSIEFNPSVNPIPHLRISTPHLSIKCRNGLVNPFFVEIGPTTINLPNIKTFCWLGISIYQDILDLLLITDKGQSFSVTQILTAPISSPSDTYIELNYEKLAGYSDDFDPNHTDHLVGEMHLFNVALRASVLKEMVLNKMTMRGWIHANQRGSLLFFYPRIETQLQAVSDIFSQIRLRPPTSLLAGFVEHQTALRSTALNHATPASVVDHTANTLGRVLAVGRQEAFVEATALPAEAISLAGSLYFTGTAYVYAQLARQITPIGPCQVFVPAFSQALCSSPNRLVSRAFVFHDGKLPGTLQNHAIPASLVLVNGTLLGKNGIFSRLAFSVDGKAHSQLRFFPAVLRAFAGAESTILPSTFFPLKAQLHGDVQVFARTSSSVQSNQRIRIAGDLLAQANDLARVASLARHEGFVIITTQGFDGVLEIIDKVRSFGTNTIVVFAHGELYILDEIPAFGKKDSKHTLDL